MLKTDKNEIQESNRQAIIWALAIFVLNVVLKSLFLGFPEIGHDEPFTLFRVQKTYAELIADLAANNHPPLFESIMWLWLRVVGYSATLLRIVPLVFSSLAAIALFWFGKRHFSLFTGAVAALLFTFSDYHFYLSHEIRSYSLFALLTVLSFNFYFRLIDNLSGKVNHSETAKHENTAFSRFLDKWQFPMLIAFNTLLLYTHYFSATIVVVQVFHALAIMKSRRLILKILKTTAISALLYLPQIIMVKSRIVSKVEGGHWLTSPSIEQLFNVLRKFFNLPLMAVIALVLLFASFWLAKKKPYFKKQLALGLLFPGIYVGMWVLAQQVPVFQDRYISFTTIGAFVLIAIAFDQLPKKLGYVSSLILVLAMAILVDYKPKNHQWAPEMVEIVKREKTEKTKVFIYPKWSLQCFSYHYNINYFKNYERTQELLADDGIYLGYKPNIQNFIENATGTEKFIIINFEGSVAEVAKDFGHLKPRIIEKERHGVMILKVE